MENIEIKYLPIDELQPADYNPRIDLQEGDPEFEKLKKSIEEFGFIDPIIYNSRTNRIVGGHQRWKAAKAIGMEKVPVVHVDLPEDHEKVLNIGLNKLGGAFDEERLGELLADLENTGIDMDLTGFDDVDIDSMIAALDVSADLDDLNMSDEQTESEDEEIESDEMEIPEGYVKYQIACTVEERETIIKAINLAKKQEDTSHSNEALAAITKFYYEYTQETTEDDR